MFFEKHSVKLIGKLFSLFHSKRFILKDIEEKYNMAWKKKQLNWQIYNLKNILKIKLNFTELELKSLKNNLIWNVKKNNK